MKRVFFVPLVLAMVMLYGCTAEPLSSLSPAAETTTLPAETTPPASTTPKPLVTRTSEPKPVRTPTQEPAQSTQEPTVVPSPTTTPVITSSWTEVSAPSNIAVAGALWIETDAGEGKKMLASVFYPEGEGPFPVVVWLHATGGFQLCDIEMARDFAESGFIGVAVGWFGGHYVGVQEITPISFPEAIDWADSPDIKSDISIHISNIQSFIDIVRTLPGARTDWVGLIGHSRGSAIGITVAASSTDINAVVALAGYPLNTPLDWLQAPILILQGTADDCINADQARAFEEKLQSLGKSFESYYYEGADHMFPYTAPWRDDMLQRAMTFFKKYLIS